MLNDIINQVRLSWRLILDDRVSMWTKAIPIFGVIYVISPFDIIPFVPIDDIAVMVGALRVFESMTPDYIVLEHRAALGMDNHLSD